MDLSTWKQIETILDRILPLDKPERTQYIKKHVDDPHLKKEINALLKAELNAPEYLDEGVDAFFTGTKAIRDITAGFSKEAFEIDRYKVEKEIGRGGMSVVYLAHRTDGEFDQKVAVKIIQPFGLDREDRFRRLRTERQILANLQHPNIARVFDGGVTPEGWPYMVMELVNGIPITTYCKEKNLDLNTRLKLFQKVCDAVTYAHRNLIVHRDLKPGNILVTERGQVKLLDFGIAKLVTENQSATPVTETGKPLMTPEYAAPEQFRGETITTSVDVYSLGVLLYELLAGVRPYDLSEKSITEMERLVCEKEPAVPSSASMLSTKSSDLLKGDLDVICLKALRKEPGNRYGSVRDLQEDIRRYLAGLPISARPATTGYRVQKFLQRHRTGVALTALAILMIAGFITALIYQQAVTLHERNRAQLEAEKATEVTEFLLGLFEANEPLTTPTDTITARTLLERGVLRAEEMDEQPLIQAQMLDVMGRVYQSLGRYDKAEPLLRKALTLQESYIEEEPAVVAASLNHLAELLLARGTYSEAEPLFKRSIDLMRAVYGEKDSSVAVTMNNLALLLEKQGKFSEAETLHREVVAMRRDLFGDAHADVSASLSNLADVLYRKGNYDEAGDLYNEALEMKIRLLGHTHTSVANTMLGLATNLEASGNFTAADSLYRETLSIQRQLFGNEHPRVATTISNFANLLIHQNQLAEAETLHKEALAIRRNYLNEANPEVGESFYSLAFLRTRMADYKKAEQLYQEAIDAWLPVLGGNHPNIALAMNNIARLLSMQDRHREALAINREVLEKHRAIYGNESPQVALSLVNIAWDLYKTEQYPEAEKYYRETLAMRRSLFGSEHPEIADALSGLGAVLCEQGTYEEAEELQKESLRMRRKLHGEDHPRIAYSLSRLGELYIRTERYNEAELLLLKAFRLRHDELGSDHPETSQSAQQLQDLYQAWNKPDKAAEYRGLLTSKEK